MPFTIVGKNKKIERYIYISAGIFVWLLLTATGLMAQRTDSARHLQEVVVTGQYQPQSLSKSVYKVRVIDKKTIEARAATNVQQLLTTALGVRFTNDMALGTTDISLMGMGGRNIKILLDGVPLSDRGDTRESLNQLDAAQVERIEIIEGPISTLYGSDALAGVINIISKGSSKKSVSLTAQVQEETAGKEYKPLGNKGLHTQSLSGRWDNGQWNVMASLLHYDFRGYGSDSTGRAHTWKPKEQWMPTVKAGYRKKRFSIYYRNDYLYETITTKGKINTDTYKAINKFFITNRMAHQLQANYKYSEKWLMNATANYTRYARHTLTKLVDYTTKTEALTTAQGEQDTAAFNTLNVRVTAQHYASPKLVLQPGLEVNNEAASGARIQGQPRVTNYAAFFSLEYKPVQNVHLRPGFRINKNTLYPAPPFIPSLNILWLPATHWELRAAYARGYRAPALRELYFNFQDANHNIKGNANLKAENSYSINTYLTYRKNRQDAKMFSVEGGFFYNTFSNLITLGVNPANSSEYIMVNIDKHKTTGFSITGRYAVKSLELSAGGLLLGQYNKILNEETIPAEQVPPFSWMPELNAELMYRIPPTKTNINIFYKYTGNSKTYQAQTRTDGSVAVSTANTQGYHYADASVQQYVHKFLTLSAGVKNLMHVTTLLSTAAGGGAHSSGSNIAFSYGRSYFISLRFHFNKN